jgi:multimeric flavodoxin WrbA
MDRLFYAAGSVFAFKPAAAIASARRAGTTASLDAVMKHFTINSMPVVSSNYWNMVHGNSVEDVLQDKEGCQIMENLGTNMAWLLKSIDVAKKAGINHPELPEKVWTNFVR